MNVVTDIRQQRHGNVWLLAIALAACLPYLRGLSLPPLEDDYIQIALGRMYGAPSQWADLLADPLYRCRATSILLTRATEQIFGNSQFVFNLQSLLLHLANALLVAALGSWPRLGYGLSLPAAFVWALSERHHEAVLWYAALPEQLVFSFVLLALLAWLHWWENGGARALGACAIFFALALLSKESGVVFCGLALAPLLFDRTRSARLVAHLAPFCLAAGIYFLANYAAKTDHLHWNDGTFRLGWHFVPVVLNSLGRVIYLWGGLALLLLLVFRKNVHWPLVVFCFAWMLVALAPYSFVAYQPRVPSRHVYLAMVGQAFLVALALPFLRRVLVPVAVAFAVANIYYVSVTKHQQFLARTVVTEELIRKATGLNYPAYAVECFAHSPSLVPPALEQRLGIPADKVSARRDGDCKSLTIKPADPSAPALVMP
ncbi:MAG: hypothetical protein NW208_11925 [Bryobacter sp.]|nr:hypothetical protein [Bryobacter sp.]